METTNPNHTDPYEITDATTGATYRLTAGKLNIEINEGSNKESAYICSVMFGSVEPLVNQLIANTTIKAALTKYNDLDAQADAIKDLNHNRDTLNYINEQKAAAFRRAYKTARSIANAKK